MLKLCFSPGLALLAGTGTGTAVLSCPSHRTWSVRGEVSEANETLLSVHYSGEDHGAPKIAPNMFHQPRLEHPPQRRH